MIHFTEFKKKNQFGKAENKRMSNWVPGINKFNYIVLLLLKNKNLRSKLMYKIHISHLNKFNKKLIKNFN